jgi:hypothetical protein
MNGLSQYQIQEIINRLEFIKGNLIAKQIRDVEQQVKELLQYCKDVEDKLISNGYQRKYGNYW